MGKGRRNLLTGTAVSSLAKGWITGGTGTFPFLIVYRFFIFSEN